MTGATLSPSPSPGPYIRLFGKVHYAHSNTENLENNPLIHGPSEIRNHPLGWLSLGRLNMEYYFS